MAVIATPSLPATNAKRLCKGAQATKQSTLALSPLDCFASARNDGRFHADQNSASVRRRHAGHRRRSRWQGKTSEDYWAFVGPFGGCTAATILRALIDHPQRAGDPLSLTVNFCAPIAEGAFDLDVRLVKANRSSQHWCVEMTQGGGEVATLATAVFAERRPSWSHQQAAFPGAAPFEQARRFPNTPMTWTHQYDFRFVEGEPSFYGSPAASPLDAYSKQWIGDHVPRKIDMLSLMSMSDAFFGRVFLARRELIPFGTVSITTYFHADVGRTRG